MYHYSSADSAPGRENSSKNASVGTVEERNECGGVPNQKNMFLSLIKRINRKDLDTFINTLLIDAYKNFFVNTNSFTPIFFYNNIYKFIDFNTEVYVYAQKPNQSKTKSIMGDSRTGVVHGVQRIPSETERERERERDRIKYTGAEKEQEKEWNEDNNYLLNHYHYKHLDRYGSTGEESHHSYRSNEEQRKSKTWKRVSGKKKTLRYAENERGSESERDIIQNNNNNNNNNRYSEEEEQEEQEEDNNNTIIHEYSSSSGAENDESTLLSFNVKNQLKNKVHLNNKSLNIYEEIYCSNFLYNKNDLNLMSINLLIFLLNQIGMYEIPINIDEENIKNIIKGNLFLFNKNVDKKNENKMLHSCFLLSALCDTLYINEFVSKENLFSLFLKSNIFENFKEYKFPQLCRSISFLTFPVSFLENKNLYIPHPMLIIAYITVILKVIDKKGLSIFELVGNWVKKNISIFVNHLIVNNYLMKSSEIQKEVNNLTTNNYQLVYKCLRYASSCNFTKQCGAASRGVSDELEKEVEREKEKEKEKENEESTYLDYSYLKEREINKKSGTEDVINHATMEAVNLDMIYTSTYYLLRLYKNYLLHIHQNYLNSKKALLEEERKKREMNMKKQQKQRWRKYTLAKGDLVDSDEECLLVDEYYYYDQDADQEEETETEKEENADVKGIREREREREQRAHQHLQREKDEHNDRQGDHEYDRERARFFTYHGQNGTDTPSKLNNKQHVFVNVLRPIENEEDRSKLWGEQKVRVKKSHIFEFNEISLNICNIIKEHNFMLQYVKDLLHMLSIFIIYNISLKDESELLDEQVEPSVLEERKKNIRIHRILQHVLPKFSIKFHCINLCLDIIEYDIGLYDEYIQQSKMKYYEYIKIILKVFMNACFYFINIIKFQNFEMLKSVAMAMKKVTNIFYFLLCTVTIKEKSNKENIQLLNKFIYDKKGMKKNAHEITTELFNSEFEISDDNSNAAEQMKKFFENMEMDIQVIKKILTCAIYFTYAMLNNQKVSKINIENISLNHINKINLKKITNAYLENNNILQVFTFILKRLTQIYYLLYNYTTQNKK